MRELNDNNANIALLGKDSEVLKLEKKMSFKNNEGKITSNWVGQ